MKHVFVLLIALIIIGCKPTNQKTYKGPDKYPSDYMYSQRIYPHGVINQKVVEEGKKIYKSSVKSNESKALGNWEQEGPFNIGGRITDIARHPVNASEFIIGTSVGGVFQTKDNGSSWKPIFDEIGSPSIGNLAISKSNPSVIYVGTGEANGSATSGAFFGTGIYKSSDGGQSWEQKGLTNSNHIGRIVVDQFDENIVYAAATGVLYGKGNNRGVYRSTDGGDNWDQLLFVSDSTACIDIAVHPTNRNIIYAAMWDRTRMPWIRNYGGPNSGLYRTTDGGQNWDKLTNGLPESNSETGRIGISISESNPNVLYTVFTTNAVTNIYHGVYKTENGGNSWKYVGEGIDDDIFRSFGWFFGNIRVDPRDENTVYVLGLNHYKTTDGGETWEIKGNTRFVDNEFIPGIHVDQHALEFGINDSDDILLGNDGGLYTTVDAMENFEEINNIPITQFYEIEVDYLRPNRLFGGTQDNNTVRTKSGNTDDFDAILGGDGFHVLVDRNDPNTVYAEYQFGNFHKSTDGGDSFERALDGIDGDDRFNWNSPFTASPRDQSLFFGSNKLYTSIAAEFWVPISDDLSKGMHPSGSTSFGTITTIECSHQDINRIYVGTDDANLWRTDDFGDNWELINGGLPDLYVTKVAVDSENDDRVFVSFSGYRKRDYVPHILMSENGGVDWIDISSNLPEIPINDIELDPDFPNTIYVATDLGTWFTNDAGNNWNVLGSGMPLTVVNDLKLHQPTRRLYAGTFGRSMFSLDVSDPVSVDDTFFDDLEINVFPNPAVDQLSIKYNDQELRNIDYSIIANNGTEVLKGEVLSQEESVDISGLMEGYYFIRFKNKDLNTSKTISFIKI